MSKPLQNEGNAESVDNDGYRRYDTSWQFDNQKNATSFLLGDIITGSKTTWGSSVRLGGFQVQRNYSTRPDLITYPLPQFIGQAALPSTVDLIINGQKTSSTEVQSGPFILNNVPFINGKGKLLWSRLMQSGARSQHRSHFIFLILCSSPAYLITHCL